MTEVRSCKANLNDKLYDSTAKAKSGTEFIRKYSSQQKNIWKLVGKINVLFDVL